MTPIENIVKEFREDYVWKNGEYRHEPEILEVWLTQALLDIQKRTLQECVEEIAAEHWDAQTPDDIQRIENALCERIIKRIERISPSLHEGATNDIT